MRFLDNTLYRKKNESADNEKDDSIKDYKNLEIKSKEKKDFLTALSGKSLYDLCKENEKENESLLVWPHSFQDCKDELKDKHILDCTFNGKDIETLRTGNLIGYIGSKKVQLEIRSRFSSEDNSSDPFLYYLLSKVFDVNIVDMKHGKGELDGIDLLIFMFSGLLKDSMRQGVFKQYVRKKYNDTNLRGTIDITRHIRYNYPPNGHIAYNTREYSYDNDITQLIRHTIEHVERNKIGKVILAADKDVAECVRIIKQYTPTYNKSERRKVMINNSRPVNHPYFTRYKSLQKLCLALLRGDKVSHGAEKDKIYGLLIDIAWLWEEYLAKLLAETKFRHCTSRREFHLFQKENKSLQAVAPDYRYAVVPDYLYKAENDEKRKYIIADAKYIPLHKYKKLNEERVLTVYYKTIMYMYRFHTDLGFLFHPVEAQENNSESILVNSYKIDNGKNCYLHEIGIMIPAKKNKSDNIKSIKEYREEFEKNEIDFVEKVKELVDESKDPSS